MSQLSPAAHRSWTELVPPCSTVKVVTVDHGCAAVVGAAVTVVAGPPFTITPTVRAVAGEWAPLTLAYRMESCARPGGAPRTVQVALAPRWTTLPTYPALLWYPPWLKLSVAPPPRTAAPA